MIAALALRRPERALLHKPTGASRVVIIAVAAAFAGVMVLTSSAPTSTRCAR